MADAKRPAQSGVAGRVGRLAALASLALTLAACSGGPPAPTLAVPSGALVLRVTDSTFQPARLTAPTGAAFVLYFDNADGLPHNAVIRAADGTREFEGDVFSGPAQRVYDVPALASGSYALRCDVHPEMSGALSVP